MPAMFKVSGLNIKDPQTGQYTREQIIEFGTENSPQLLKDIIPQDLDMDVDVGEGMSQDKSVVRKQMMQEMPETLRISEGKSLDHQTLTLQIIYHFGDRDMIIRDSRGLSYTLNAIPFQLHHKRWLMRFGSL
jgi:hypothetical protein